MIKTRKIIQLVETCKDCPNYYQINANVTNPDSVISSSTPMNMSRGYITGGITFQAIDRISFDDKQDIIHGTGNCSIKKKEVVMNTIPDWCPLEKATESEIIITKLTLEAENESRYSRT